MSRVSHCSSGCHWSRTAPSVEHTLTGSIGMEMIASDIRAGPTRRDLQARRWVSLIVANDHSVSSTVLFSILAISSAFSCDRSA